MIPNTKLSIIKLNDLLQLTETEIDNTKIRFNQGNGNENPIDLYKNNPNELLNWQYWNSQKFKQNQLVIGFVQLHDDEWLLFTIGRIKSIRDLGKDRGVGYDFETLNDQYGKFFGRVVVTYKKYHSQQCRLAKNVFDLLVVKEILPDSYGNLDLDFTGYDNVSLSYEQLKSIVEGGSPLYREKLKTQQGVYVLTDKKTGKLYVGSATSKEHMLFGRWAGYVKTFHNNNKALVELHEKYGDDYFKKNFTYTIIENFDARVSVRYIQKRESYWKEVFQTKTRGYNRN